MTGSLRPRPFVLLALALLILPTAVALCQGIESYSMVHTFGLSSATTTRIFGMGGQVSCVWDQGFGNPAFAATQDRPNASLRLMTTDFDRGPDMTSEQLHLVWPLEPDVSGLQLSLFSLQGDAAPVMLMAGPGIVDVSEDDVSLHYGRRFGPKLTAGIGMSPYSQIEFSVQAPGGPMLMNVKAESDWGARLGMAYEWRENDYIGVVYDYYQETAKAVGPAVGGRAKRVYHTDLLALGISSHVRPDLLLAAEYKNASTNDGQLSMSLSGWHVGAEYRPVNDWAVRAGMNDEKLTFGLGYRNEEWQVDYAFLNRWNDDIVGSLFGSSDSHGLQAIYRW